MYILYKEKNEYGGYNPIQSWVGSVPDGFYQVMDTFDFDTFAEYNGFVNLTVKRNIVVGITPNTEVWEVWKKEHPDEPEPEPGGDSAALQVLDVLLGVTE